MATKKITLSSVIANINAFALVIITEVVAIVKEYAKSKDCGKYGNIFETVVNAIITCVASHRKPATMHDVFILGDKEKHNYSIECKTNCGMLVNGLSKEQAELMVNDVNAITKAIHASFICYCPMFRKPIDLYNARVLYTRDFVKLLNEYKLLRVKKQSNGSYCIAIQNYLPTENFTGLRRGQDFLEKFYKYQTLEKFAVKYAVKE